MIVFDVDQTLRDNTGSEHLVPDDMTRSENWLPWTDYVSEHSKVIERTAFLYKLLVESEKTVYLVTSSQRGIKEWLERNGLPLPCKIVTRELDDRRSPSRFKMQWVDDHQEEIELWVDDDPKVCKYVRDKDIDVLQVWLPEGHPLKERKDV